MDKYLVEGSVTNGFSYEVVAKSSDDAMNEAYKLADKEFGCVDSFEVDTVEYVEEDEQYYKSTQF